MSKKIEISSKPFKGIRLPKWNIEEMTDYKPKTTFWDDFWIAIHFGKDAVLDTYKRAFNEWKNDYIYVTELVLVLNHIGWALYKPNEDMAHVFFELWEKCNDWFWENLQGDEKDYFSRVTD